MVSVSFVPPKIGIGIRPKKHIGRALKTIIILRPFCPLGDAIAQLTDVGTAVTPPVDRRTTVFSDRTGMVKAARMLLSSVTKVLVLADRIVIKQIITSRNKVGPIVIKQIIK